MSEANIHASCVAIGSAGVLLLGPSGAGKSDMALRLIDDGATLVADDRTILFIDKGAWWAKPPTTIRGLIEIRGVGIVKMPVRARVKIRSASDHNPGSALVRFGLRMLPHSCRAKKLEAASHCRQQLLTRRCHWAISSDRTDVGSVVALCKAA